MKKYIDSLKILNKNGLYTIRGNINIDSLMNMKDVSILGYGIEGYIVAAYVAAINRSNVGFIRNKEKEYGTCKRIDGFYNLKNNVVLFTSSDNVYIVEKFIQTTNIKCDLIYYFDVVNSRIINLEPLEFDNIPEYYQCDINSYKKLLTGKEFILSSGAKSNVYYETLTAANTYTLLNDMIRENEKIILSNKVMGGVGYGGIYFGLLAALISQKPFLAIDVNSVLDTLKIDKILLFDDCTSTGSTIHKLCDLFQMDIYKISVLSLYVKRRAFLTIPNIKECSIL